jgi:hypothetical protein
MDLTAQREADQNPDVEPEDEIPEGALEFTPDEVKAIEAADERTVAAQEMLERLSTPEQTYGFPAEIEKIALTNAMFTLLVEKGVCTMQEVFVAKREAIADQADQIVELSKAHKREVSMAKIAASPADMPKAPPGPPKQQHRRARRG